MSRLDVYDPESRFSSGSVDLRRCRKRMYEGAPYHGSHQCTRPAVIQEEGYGWCRAHAPNVIRIRKQEQAEYRKQRQRKLDYRTRTELLEREIVAAALRWYRLMAATEGKPIPLPASDLEKSCKALETHLAEQP